MKRFSRLATVGAVAVLGVGAGAGAASAYSISGGAYTGTATANHTSTFGGAYTFDCPSSDVSYSGTATGADTTSFTPDFGFSCDFFGFPAMATQSGAWSLKVVAGPDMNGYYDGELAIPVGTATTNESPLPGCEATFSGPQAFRHGFSSTVIRMKNVGGDVTLEMDLNGIAYSAAGPCFGSGSGGVYSTNGVVTLPGVVIS